LPENFLKCYDVNMFVPFPKNSLVLVAVIILIPAITFGILEAFGVSQKTATSIAILAMALYIGLLRLQAYLLTRNRGRSH
jgi:hypothetical protein